MRRWLKQRLPQRQALERRWYLRPFARILLEPKCWSFNRNSVAKAFAAGLFVAFVPPTPFLPVHLTLCVVLGVALRLNLPIVFATSFLSNPFTWVPQVLASIWVGAKLLGLDLEPLIHVFKHKGFSEEMHALWGPLLLGALVLGAVAAAVGYGLAQCAWRVRVIYLVRRRRGQTSAKSDTFD
jgi:uncharacterized protein